MKSWKKKTKKPKKNRDNVSNFHFPKITHALTANECLHARCCQILCSLSPAGVCADLSCVGAAETRQPQINGSVCWA